MFAKITGGAPSAVLLAAVSLLVAACSAPVLPKESQQTPAPLPTATSIAPVVSPTPVSTVPTALPPATLPGTTPTTGIPGQCTLQSGNAACDLCGQQSCCQQITACESNQDCIAADACVSQCYLQYGSNPQAGQACEQQCGTTHPTGTQALQALLQCLDTVCVQQCGGGQY